MASQVILGRPLGPGEELALKVAGSGRIATGRVVSMYDTTYAITLSGPPAPRMLREVMIVTFERERNLRGHAPRRFRFLQWLDNRTPSNSKEGARGTTMTLPRAERAIVFLEDLDSTPCAPEDRRIARWATRDFLTANGTSTFEKVVRAEIARQSPDALIAASSRIVLASRNDPHWSDSQKWIVERTFRGAPARIATVRAVSPEARPPGGRCLLFLRRVGNRYEPVRLGGGFVSVRGSHVPAWNCSLDEAIAKITRAAR